MTPTIDGQVHHFEYRGLFNGGSVLWDRETGTYWHHVSGLALHGPLKGRRLPIFNLLQGTVDQALDAHPDLEVAVSDRPIRRRSRWAPLSERVRGLSDRFKATMSGEDPRRPSMDIGLGAWTEGSQKYFPMAVVEERGRFVFDEMDGRRLLVHIEPTANSILALYTDARDASWDGVVLRLADGRYIRAGALFSADGTKLEVERPMQVFTRWYGFALTFPEVRVYQP